MKKVFSIVLLAFFSSVITACGGGESDVRDSAVPLRAFSDGSGIGRYNSLLFYTPDLRATMNSEEENDNPENGIKFPDSSNIPVVAQYLYADLRRGVATFENESINVAAIVDRRSAETAAVFMEVPDRSDLIVVGSKPSLVDVPRSGIYRYTGTQTSGERSVPAPGQIGAFTLDVNFSTGAFVFSGQTATFSATASGSFDVTVGLFASESVTITADGRSYVGHLYGQLHGAGARGTTGIIVTDDFQADYAGAFIGVR